jgi:signal transduction histidine kinase
MAQFDYSFKLIFLNEKKVASSLRLYFNKCFLKEINPTMQRAIKNEAPFRMFIDRITDGFIALDKDFCYIYVNAKIGELVRRDPGPLIGKNVWQEFPEAVDSTTYKAFQTAMKEQRFISNIDYYAPLDLWQENYIYPSPEGLSIFIKDISDRKKLERELKEQEKNQQFEIMITALEAQEKERTHIGQELHDNVNQLLVATKLMLAVLRDDPARVSKEVLSDCVNNLEKAIEENRKLSHELVTPDLKAGNLVKQLKQLFTDMLTANGIGITMQLEQFNEQLLEEQKKLGVYRIAQEQCTNIVKHARAGNVTVTLATTEEKFTMTITDDGQGMDPDKAMNGIGIRNIEGRVRFFDGSLQIHTKPGNGFALEINLPLYHLTPAEQSFSAHL